MQCKYGTGMKPQCTHGSWEPDWHLETVDETCGGALTAKKRSSEKAVSIIGTLAPAGSWRSVQVIGTQLRSGSDGLTVT